MHPREKMEDEQKPSLNPKPTAYEREMARRAKEPEYPPPDPNGPFAIVPDGPMDLPTSVYQVALKGDVKVVMEWLDGGGHIDARCKGGYQMTLLMAGCVFGHMRLVEPLLERGAHVNLMDLGENTALMVAADHGHVAIVKKLLSSGARTDMKDIYGRTALSLAEDREWTAVVELIRQHDASTPARAPPPAEDGKDPDEELLAPPTTDREILLRRHPDLTVCRPPDKDRFLPFIEGRADDSDEEEEGKKKVYTSADYTPAERERYGYTGPEEGICWREAYRLTGNDPDEPDDDDEHCDDVPPAAQAPASTSST